MQETQKINIRQQLYKKYRLEGLGPYKAAIKAGYAHATAWNAHANIEKRCPDWNSLFAKAGLDTDALIKYINEALEAKKPIACDVFIHNENGELKVNKNSNDWIEVEDWHARHKFLQTALELMKLIKTGTHVTVNTKVEVNGSLTRTDKDRQQELLSRLGRYFQD